MTLKKIFVLNILEKFDMENDISSKKKELNECDSCRNWKVEYAKSKSQIFGASSIHKKLGLCIGGGFDGFQTQSDETCSMWKPLLDKERILPIFHDGGNDY